MTFASKVRVLKKVLDLQFFSSRIFYTRYFQPSTGGVESRVCDFLSHFGDDDNDMRRKEKREKSSRVHFLKSAVKVKLSVSVTEKPVIFKSLQFNKGNEFFCNFGGDFHHSSLISSCEARSTGKGMDGTFKEGKNIINSSVREKHVSAD